MSSGRPPLPPHERKSHMLLIRLSPVMWDDFKRLGVRLGLPPSTAARQILSDGLKRAHQNGG